MTRALLQQALEALEGEMNCDPYIVEKVTPMLITAIREYLAQPEQEPVEDEWTPCVKLPITVHVRKQRPGEAHVSTREGITPLKPDDLIMRGVAGEEYPIGRELFERTYTLHPKGDE